MKGKGMGGLAIVAIAGLVLWGISRAKPAKAVTVPTTPREIGGWELQPTVPTVAPTLTPTQTATLKAIKAEAAATSGALTTAQGAVLERTIAAGGEPYISQPEGEPYVDPGVLVQYQIYQAIDPSLPAPSTPEEWTGFYPTQVTLDYLAAR